MSSMKILSLPLLANEKILKFLDSPDLLRFANCSSKTANLVRLVKFNRLKLSVRLRQKSAIIEFKDPNDKRRVFNLVINKKDHTGENGFGWDGLGGLKFFESPVVQRGLNYAEGPVEDELSDPGDVSSSEESDADGSVENAGEHSDEESDDYGYDEDLVASPNWYCQVSSPTNQSIFKVADLLMTYLFESCKLHEMSLWPTEGSKQLIESHKQLQRCDSLTIIDFWTSEICRPLTKKLMEWSIDAVEARDHCFYRCNVIGNFKYKSGFKPRRVDVEYGHWVHLNAILDSESEYFNFYRYLPSSTFLNSLLKAWISNGKMKNMKAIKWSARKVRDLTETFFKKVMDGTPEATMTEEERQRVVQKLREMYWRESDGEFTKFIRRVDGKLAAVYVNTLALEFAIASF